MTGSRPLLTIVLEDLGLLDRESVMYRRLISARLESEDLFSIRHVDEPLSTQIISELCSTIGTKYVVFMRSTHEISMNYMASMLEYLNTRTVYLAEPIVYTGSIPDTVKLPRFDHSYYYARDSDIYGIAFNTRRLGDLMEAISDIDPSALYISYRLYWSIDTVEPLKIGFTVASDIKSATGLLTDRHIQRLFPLIATTSTELRLYLLRYFALFLRGMRAQKETQVPLAHLREVINTFSLAELIEHVDAQQPFEGAWIRWLADTTRNEQLYKQLSESDAYLIFQEGTPVRDFDIELYQIGFGRDVLTIGKSYLPSNQRPDYDQASSYDFYRRPVGPKSTILFFDRPLQADDNAEYLYEYFIANYPEYGEAYFALSTRSADWTRLKQKGFKLIPIFTTEFYEKFLISDLVVSSQIFNLRYSGKTLANSRFVYLQHGVQLNDMKDWVLSKYFDVFVATGQKEADYLKMFAPLETLNSGLPRYETLVRAQGNPKHLLFMPTWRFNLHQHSTEQFTQSQYFHAINALLTDPGLLEYLHRTDRTLQVKLHPNVEKRASQFHFSERITKSNLSYREAIASAEAVFTDYSSAVLDAAFIGIPIVYYHWDAADFFRDQPYESRLDYRIDGLGPVFEDHSELIKHIVGGHYLNPSDEYARRREHFFQGVDPTGINSKIIERMLTL